ncbi:MAG: hypothetical protein ABIW82_17695 [Dokdonella sp.]
MQKPSTALAICALVASTIALSHAAEPATDFSVAVVKGSIGLPAESGETSISSLAVGDFNCDGNADIAVGDEISTVGGRVGAGSVTIAFGDPLVPIRALGQRINQDSSGVNGVAEEDDRFGSSLAIADFDSDSCADLAVGTPREAVGSPTIQYAGDVGLFFGGAGGLDQVNDLSLPLLSEAAPNGPSALHFKGSGLTAIEHFTSASSLPMLAIGAPGHSPFGASLAGGASIRRSGTAAGGLGTPVVFVERNRVAGQSDTTDDALADRNGASGDFNNDGHADLALSGNGGSGNSGYVLIVYGADTAGGINYEYIDQHSPGVPGGVENGDLFGSALTAGDFNGDGFDDLAVSAIGEDISGVVDAGSVTILFGAASGLLAHAGSSIAINEGDISGLAMETSDYFGEALANGDFNRDGFDDLLVGVPSHDLGTATSAGIVLVVPGSAAGPDTAAARIFSLSTPGMPGSPRDVDRFGAQLAVGDFNNDNVDDFVVGIPGRADDSGTRKGAIALVYSVSDTQTSITSVSPAIATTGASYTVNVRSARTPVVGLPSGRGVVAVSASNGASCNAIIAGNGSGQCSLIAPATAGTITLAASYIAQIGFRASAAGPFAYTVIADDSIFRNGFDNAN